MSVKTRVEVEKKKKKHMQTARFKKIKPAHHHMFEGLFLYLFIYQFIYLFICFYLLAIFTVQSR